MDNVQKRNIRNSRRLENVSKFSYNKNNNNNNNNNNNFLHGGEPLLRSHQLRSHSRMSQYFMKLEGSLPYLQEPSTGRYPEPDQSSPYDPIISL
jgi:hypothetical protein